jgi:DNA-binding CsgD family transcriptional regulator
MEHDSSLPAERAMSEGWHTYKLPKDSLTPRELDVCRLLLDGLALKEIATTCFVSASTVDCHTRSIYRKLSLHSRAELFKHFASEPVVEVRTTPRTSDSVQILRRLELMERELHEIARYLGIRSSSCVDFPSDATRIVLTPVSVPVER